MVIWLVSRLVEVPLKATAGGFKLGFWTGRTVGWRRIALVGLGVGIGLLVAPGPGQELRARLREKLEGSVGPAAASPPAPADPLPADPLPAAPDADPAAVDPSTY